MPDSSSPQNIVYQVPAGISSVRLDLFLSEQNLKLSRSQIQKLTEQKLITINGKTEKSAHKLHGGETIEIQIPPAQTLETKPENIDIEIIFEDKHLAIINKPVNLVVHAAKGHASGTLVNALLYHLKDLSNIGGFLRPGIVHRLDKGTSGIMIIAKDNEAHRLLVQAFQERKIEKTYLTLAYGVFKKQEGILENKIGRSRTNRKKISSKTTQGKDAITHYKVIQQHPKFPLNLLEVKPKTGRTHQIRVHLAEAGHPIVGDPLYGGKQWVHKLSGVVRELVEKLEHQALHAWKIKFEHPITKKKMEFEATIPEKVMLIFP